MKIAVIGTGYVGFTTGVGLAEIGHSVVCIDREMSKIDKLKNGQLLFFEQNLEELFIRNQNSGRISFDSNMQKAVSQADMVIIAVGTPPHPVTKEADMKYIHAAATELADFLQGYTVVATKSTVPVGTGDDIETLIKKKNPKADFDVVSLPEFLREGFAVHDFFHPDRIIVGANSERAFNVIKNLYAYFADKTKILYVKRRSAETIKYAANAFLAMKIHYVNELADFCEKADVDIFEVAQGMGADSRIGDKFLQPGPGYGGSCFPKDTLAMAYMARQNGVDLRLINAVIQGNNKRKKDMAERIMLSVKRIDNPKIAVWGLAFKAGTDDCRESPAIDIIAELLEYNANIAVYDPKAMEKAKILLGNKVSFAENMYLAVQDADVLVILTEWQEFEEMDLEKVAGAMRTKTILDFRNCLDKEKVKACGFAYQGIGRK